MRIVVLYGLIVLAIAGCSTLSRETHNAESPTPAVPSQPVGYEQRLSNRDPYAGFLPYVMCFGKDCDRPTPKHIAQPVPRVPLPPAQPNPVKEMRVKESLGFLYNTTELDPGSMSILDEIIKTSMNAREIWIKGYAGLTYTNRSKENAVMALALARAQFVQSHMKAAHVPAHITVGAELVRCKSEDECLKRFKFGGRRADLDIVIISGEKSGEQHN